MQKCVSMPNESAGRPLVDAAGVVARRRGKPRARHALSRLRYYRIECTTTQLQRIVAGVTRGNLTQCAALTGRGKVRASLRTAAQCGLEWQLFVPPPAPCPPYTRMNLTSHEMTAATCTGLPLLPPRRVHFQHRLTAAPDSAPRLRAPPPPAGPDKDAPANMPAPSRWRGAGTADVAGGYRW